MGMGTNIVAFDCNPAIRGLEDIGVYDCTTYVACLPQILVRDCGLASALQYAQGCLAAVRSQARDIRTDASSSLGADRFKAYKPIFSC